MRAVVFILLFIFVQCFSLDVTGKNHDALIPTAAFTATTVCKGNATVFTNNSTTMSGSILSNVWDFGDGTGSTVTNPEHVYTSSGTFSVTLTVTNTAGDVDDYTATVTVRPSGTVNFNISSTNNCESSQFTFTNLSSIVSGSFSSYTWNFGDGATATSTSTTHTYSTSGTYTVTLSTVSNLGCTNSVSKTLEVDPEAVVDFSFSNQCLGNDIEFVNTTTVATGLVNYSWTFGDTQTSTAESPDHSYNTQGTYSVKLTATTEEGCVTNVTKSATVYPIPATAFTVADHCFATNAVFTNTSTIASGTLTYAWVLGDGSTSTSTSPTYLYPDYGNYEVTLTATSNFGCVDSETKFVYVNAKPIVDFQFQNVCDGTAMDFVNNSTLAEGDVDYTWTFGDTQSSTEVNPSHTYGSASNFTVGLTAISESGCSTSTSKSVSVYPVPVPVFTIADQCYGDDAQFNNASTITSGTMTYVWDLGDGATSTATSPVYEYDNIGNYRATLTATSNNGCVNSVYHDFYVNAKPVVAFSFDNKCFGEAAQFTNETTTAEGTIDYDWDFGDTNTSDEVNPAHDYAVEGTYTVELTATTNRGCSTVESASIEIYPVPVPAFAVVDHCFASDVTFDNQSTIAGGTNNFVWDFGNGDTSTDEEPVYLYPAIGNFRVNLTVTSDEGCVKEVYHNVNVFAKPVVDFTLENVCFGTTSRFYNNSTTTEDAVTYDWNFGDSQSSTEINPVHNYAGSGNYTVSLTATTENGCITDLTKPLEIYPMPLTAFLVDDHCFGSDAIFENTTTIASGTVTYAWELGDGDESTDQHPVHRYPATGNYKAILTATSDKGCIKEFFKYIFINPKPIVDFTLRDVCLGDESNFVNNSIPGGEVVYEWEFGDSNTSTAINPVHTYATYGTFDVTLTAVTPNAGCSTSKTLQTTVSQTPQALFEAKDNCLDSLIHFTNNTYYEGDDVTYLWQFGNGLTSAEKHVDHGYTSAQTYLVTLTASAGNGCSTAITKPVKVYPQPAINFSMKNVCDTEVVEFENFSTISSGNITNQWQFGDDETSEASEPEHQYATYGTYMVTLTVTSDAGCTVIKEKPVEVYPLPETDFIAPAVCDSKPVIFTNTSVIESGQLVEYRWDFGDQTNSIIRNPTKEYLSDGTYAVTLVSISDQGCQTSVTKDITVYPPVVADFSVQDVCFHHVTQTTNTSSITSGELSYRWEFGDGTGTSVATSPSYSYGSPGLYTIKLLAIADTGCKDSITHPVVVYHLPLVNAGEDQTVSQGYSVQLSGTGALEYVWSPVETLDNSSVPYPNTTPLATTDYVLTGTDRFGCVNADTVRVTVVEEFRLVATNVLTPDENGQNDTWIIENVETFGDVHVRVYNRWGKLVFEQEAYQNDWKGMAGKDLLPDGAYYYYITFGSSDKVYKGALTILRNQ